jgi:glycosyltransferase involved in cell wall biosynthesis
MGEPKNESIPHKPGSIWAVAVFAHNEASQIAPCLDSLLTASQNPSTLQIFVLNNGSSDNTSEIVSAYALKFPQVRLIEIQRADKANAWNYFVHDLAPQADCFFFVDGDVTFTPGSLDELHTALEQNKYAHIATGVPYSGRHRLAQLAVLLTHGGVLGNLYAAQAEFIAEVRQRKLRMPIGFIREDGLVGAFAMFNLAPLINQWDKTRVVTVTTAGFLFPSLRWWNFADMRLYWHRRIRYSIGHFQNLLLEDILLHKGIAAIPIDDAGLYASAPLPTLKWRGLDTFFDVIALAHINHRRPSNATHCK